MSNYDYENADEEYNEYSYIGRTVNGVSEFVSDVEYWEATNDNN